MADPPSTVEGISPFGVGITPKLKGFAFETPAFSGVTCPLTLLSDLYRFGEEGSVRWW
jgi:hypothetical protein